MPHVGFYSGSFDPITLGHTDVIARALTLVDYDVRQVELAD